MDLPLKWHGGKGAHQARLAKWIISLMPKHVEYVEPYFGGGAVLLNKDPEGVAEVVAELNGELTNFWDVLRNTSLFRDLKRKLEATPFSEIEWQRAVAYSQRNARRFEARDRVEDAWAFFVRCRQSLAGRNDTFAPLTKTRTRRGMNEQASAWISAIEGLPAVHARLKRVAILNADALDVIKGEDSRHCVFYLDPPYLDETRKSPKVYEFEMTWEQHSQLLAQLGGIEGKFLLSGYRSQLYDDAADLHGWKRHEFKVPNNAAGGKKKRVMTECLWTNF